MSTFENLKIGFNSTVNLIYLHLKYYPATKSLNYFWSFGFLLSLSLVIQILTGFFFKYVL